MDCAPYTHSQVGYTVKSIKDLRTLQAKYPSRAAELEEIIDFWKEESTFRKLLHDAPSDVHKYQFPRGEQYDSEGYYRAVELSVPGAGILSGSYDTRIVGLMPDYQKLFKMGLPGLSEHIERYKEKNPSSAEFYDSLLICVNIIRATLENFRVQAAALDRLLHI